MGCRDMKFIYTRHLLNEGLNEDVIWSFCKALKVRQDLNLTRLETGAMA